MMLVFRGGLQFASKWSPNGYHFIKKWSPITEGRIALFTSELVESDLIMLQKNRAGHGQSQGYKF